MTLAISLEDLLNSSQFASFLLLLPVLIVHIGFIISINFKAFVFELVVLHKLICAAVVGVPLVEDILRHLVERFVNIEVELE